jgi:hypothetical protein
MTRTHPSFWIRDAIDPEPGAAKAALRFPGLKNAMRASGMTIVIIITLTLISGCSSFRFEPTANWWRDGGRLCAASREPFGSEFYRDAPRSCANALADSDPASHPGATLNATHARGLPL